jgi:uncharacterized lipoprotein YbaY
MRQRRRRLAAFFLVVLAGCGVPPGQPGELTVLGQLQLPRSAATAGEAVVELRDTTDDRVLAEQRQPLRSHQTNLPFRLQLSRDALTAGHALNVRAAVLLEGWAQWLSEPVAVHAQRGSIDLGTLALARAQRPLAFQTRIDCGARNFVVGMAGDVLTLRAGEKSYALKALASAPDERFEAVGDASTFVWALGRSATVSVGGSVYAGCSVSR